MSSLPVIAIPVCDPRRDLLGVYHPDGIGRRWPRSRGRRPRIVLVRTMSPSQLPGSLTLAALEAGIVMLLLGDSQILAKALFLDGFGESLTDFMTGITTDKHGSCWWSISCCSRSGSSSSRCRAVHPRPESGPACGGRPTASTQVHFGLIMVFNLVLALNPSADRPRPVPDLQCRQGPIERLSITIIPWLAVSLAVLFLVTYTAQRRGAGHLAPGRLNRAHLLAAAGDCSAGGRPSVPSAWLVDHLPPLTSAAARLGLRRGPVLLGRCSPSAARSVHPGVGWRPLVGSA